MKMESVDEKQELEGKPVVKKKKTNLPEKKISVETEKSETTQINGQNYWPIPKEELPSKYKLYNEGTSLLGRPLTVLEVKKLSGLTEENVNYIVNDILKKAVKGLPIEELLVADKLFLIFWLRANTYKDSGYKVSFPCTKCEKESSYSFNLEDLDAKHIQDDYEPDKELNLPVNGNKLKFKYQRVSDEEIIEKFKNQAETNKNIEVDEQVLNVATVITEINGEELPLKKKYNYLINLSPADYTVIESYVESIDIGIVPVVQVKCGDCGGIGPAALTFRGDFFLPKYSA